MFEKIFELKVYDNLWYIEYSFCAKQISQQAEMFLTRTKDSEELIRKLYEWYDSPKMKYITNGNVYYMQRESWEFVYGLSSNKNPISFKSIGLEELPKQHSLIELDLTEYINDNNYKDFNTNLHDNFKIEEDYTNILINSHKDSVTTQRRCMFCNRLTEIYCKGYCKECYENYIY